MTATTFSWNTGTGTAGWSTGTDWANINNAGNGVVANGNGNGAIINVGNVSLDTNISLNNFVVGGTGVLLLNNATQTLNINGKDGNTFLASSGNINISAAATLTTINFTQNGTTS